MLNNLSILGRVTKPLELRYLQNGTAVLNFDIANSIKVKDNEVTTFLKCVCYGRSAEVINQFVSKGDRVLLQGELRQNSYQDSSGDTKSYHFLQVNSFDFIESKNKEQAQQAQQAPQMPTTQQTKEQKQRADFVKNIIEINDDVIPF